MNDKLQKFYFWNWVILEVLSWIFFTAAWGCVVGMFVFNGNSNLFWAGIISFAFSALASAGERGYRQKLFPEDIMIENDIRRNRLSTWQIIRDKYKESR